MQNLKTELTEVQNNYSVVKGADAQLATNQETLTNIQQLNEQLVKKLTEQTDKIN